MTFKQLPYLLAIASEGSLSAAARKLNLSQPALSSFLKQLEEQIGLPLFTVSKGQNHLSEAGLLLARSHRTILNLYKQMESQIHDLAGKGLQLPAVLRIGTTPHIDAECITEAWLKFRHQYPAIKLNIENMKSHLLRSSLEEGELDLVLSPLMDVESPSFLSYPIFYEPMAIVVPDCFPLPKSDVLPSGLALDQFAQYPFIFREPTSILGMVQRSLLQQAGIQPNVIAQCGNYTMFRAMLSKEKGVSILPLRMVPDHPQLHSYPLQSSAKWTVGLLTRQDTPLTSAALAWGKYIAEEFLKLEHIHLCEEAPFFSASFSCAASGTAPAAVNASDRFFAPLDLKRQKVLDTSMLSCFCAAARFKSISAAAEALYLSQPYLSRRLSSLEKRMDVVLFNRCHNGIELTRAGRLYLEFAEKVLTEQEQTHQKLCQLRSLAS